MNYKVKIVKPVTPFSSHTLSTRCMKELQEARDVAAAFIQERMDAFGDDPRRCASSAGTQSEAEALDML